MRRLIISLAALAAVLALPGLASAHTGSVACPESRTDTTLIHVIQFSYQANFAHDTTVTEIVQDAATGKGTVQTFLVHANTAVSHTVPSPASSVIVSATWRDGTQAGSIGPVTLTGCSPAPSVAPTVCTPTTTTVYVDVPGATQYVDVPGPTTYVDRVKTKVVYRTRIKWKTRIKLIPYTPVKNVKGVKFESAVTG